MRTILMLMAAASITLVQSIAAQTWQPPPDSQTVVPIAIR